MEGFIYWILVGLVAGWLAGKVMKGAGYGVLMDIVLGILGGIVGGMGIWTSGPPRRRARGFDRGRLCGGGDLGVDWKETQKVVGKVD